jgi:hypothetical protein
MKVYRWSKGIAPRILNLGAGQFRIQYNAPATLPKGKNTASYRIDGLAIPRTVLDASEEKKNLSPVPAFELVLVGP